MSRRSDSNLTPKGRWCKSIGCALPVILTLLFPGCAALQLSDNLDWTSISEENEQASWAARRHNALGIKWMSHGKLGKAETHFQKAAELSPRYAAPRNNLGYLCLAREELYFAAWHFERASELAPTSPEPFLNLGLVYERAGQFGQAEECYRNACEISAINPSAVGNLARVLIKSDGDPMEIHQLLTQLKMIDTRPNWLDWADLLLSTRYMEGPEQLFATWASKPELNMPSAKDGPNGDTQLPLPEIINPPSIEESGPGIELLPPISSSAADIGKPNHSAPKIQSIP